MKFSVLATLLGLCLLSTSASARVRDASARFRPSNLGLADINGDRVDDWVGLKDAQRDGVSVRLGSNTTFPITYLRGGATSIVGPQVFPQYTFTGRFTNDTLDDVCVFHVNYAGWSNPRITCYQFDLWSQQMYSFGSGGGAAGGDMTAAMPTQVPPTNENKGYAVGDFDGDGFDEVLTYNRNNGTSVKFWRFNPFTGKFVPHTSIDVGNLADLNWEGGVDVWTGELNSADPNGAHRDDVLVYNRTHRQLALYLNVVWNGRPIFWWMYTSGTSLQAGDEIAIANADGDHVDDLITIRPSTGAMRFLSLEWARLLQPLAVVQGNIPSAHYQPLHMMWSSNAGARDQMTAIFADTSVARYAPANESSGQKTYWWVGSYSTGYVWGRIDP